MSVRIQRNSLPLLCLNFKKTLLELGWWEYFRDDFDDGIIIPEWKKENTDANKTFDERSNALYAKINGGAHASLWYDRIDCPIFHYSLPALAGKAYRITTKLNHYTINAATFAGIVLAAEKYIDNKMWIKFNTGRVEPLVGETISQGGYALGTLMAGTLYLFAGSWAMNNAEGFMCLENRTSRYYADFGWCTGSVGGANIFFGRFDSIHKHIYSLGLGYRGAFDYDLQLCTNSSRGAWDADGTRPVWLQIRISTAGVVTYHYSTDGDSYQQYESPVATPYSHNISDITGYADGLTVGLLVVNAKGAPADIDAPFEYFLIEVEELGHAIKEECLAPIDTRASTTFYHGRIKQMSSLKRAVDDKTGLFQIADMSITLANEDKHYSQLMASRILKNQEAILYHTWTKEDPHVRTEIIKLIVDDHSMKGPDFMIKFTDITQKYFTKKIPENICTKDNFPWIHPDYEAWPMPEILGNASLVGEHEYPGAVQAVYVNTAGAPYRCLASAGKITIPTDEVWVGTAQKEEGVDYDIVEVFGRTYIDFGVDPEEESVTFNAHGYSVPVWDSDNNYIQNLAYIIQYLLRYIIGIPHSLINSPSFLKLAGYYEEMGVDENCYLILQDRVDSMEVLRELLFTGGAKGFMAMDGKFNVRRKNICNWEIDSNKHHIFEQIELFGPPDRQWNLTSAINTVNVEYGLIPWQNLYAGSKSEYRDNRFERPMEDRIRRERPLGWRRGG